MEGYIAVEKGKHLFKKIPPHLPEKERAELKKQQRLAVKREYSKDYYNKNTNKRIEYFSKLYREKLGKKVICPLCDRVVCLERLPKHQKTNLCHKFSARKNFLKDNE